MSIAQTATSIYRNYTVDEQYQYCGIVKEPSDLRGIKAAFMLDFATDIIVARYHPEGKNRRIHKITDLFPLLTEAKRKGARGDEGKRVFIYRQL
jgi:hypothetical protein